MEKLPHSFQWKFNVTRLSSILALLICSHAVFNPLQAWIDHIFDFHPVEVEQDWNGSNRDWQENQVWAEIGSREQDREQDRGTCLDGPDRDK